MSTAAKTKPGAPRPSASRPRPSAAPARAATIDPFRVLRRHLLLIISAAVIGGILGVGAHLALVKYYPLYTGFVLFEVQPGVQEASDVGTPQPLQEADIARVANTELVLLSSRNVLTNAMKDPDVQTGTKWFQDNYVEGGAMLVDDAVDDLIDSLGQGLVRGTQLFQIEWSTHQATDVPTVLNAVARAYITERRRLDDGQYGDNLKLFKDQLANTNREIRELEQKMDDHLKDAGITNLDDPRYSEKAQAVKAIVAEIGNTQLGLDIIRTRLMQTRAKIEGQLNPSADDIAEAENDYSVATHIRLVENLKVQLRVSRDSFDASHRALLDAEARLRAAEAEKKAKTEEIIERNLNARLRTYESEEESLRRRLENLEDENVEKNAELTELAAKQAQYQAMESQQRLLETRRENELGNISELELMRLRSDAERVDVVQFSETPRERSFPKAPIIVPLGVVLTVGFVIALVFLREITDQRVKTASDLAVLPGARVLGVIPDLDEDPTRCKAAELVIRREPTSVLAESYRQAFTPIAKAVDRQGYQTIVFIGAMPGAGTTAAISNVATAFAGAGKRVAVVDANFRRPRLGTVMGITDEQTGLADVLAGDASLEETLVETEFGPWVLAAGTPASRIIEQLSSEGFDRLLAELRSQFDVVLFDAPPAVVAGDALSLAGRVDSAVFVVRANREHRGLVARLISQIADTHCSLIGLVLNRPRGTAGGYFKKNFATMAEYAAKDA